MVIAGTGHRPPKLGGYGSEPHLILVELAMDWIRENNPTRIISGGALGWDTALARAADLQGIPYVMALPFEGFDSKWPIASQRSLLELEKRAAEVLYVSPVGYAPWKMQARNEWMVNNCNLVLAMWDGSPGGTGNCIAYANKVKKPIINLYEKWKKDNG